MSKMNNFLMDAAYAFQSYHPIYSFEECMERVTRDDTMTIQYWREYREMMRRVERSAMKITLDNMDRSKLERLLDMFRYVIQNDENIKKLFDNSAFFFRDGGRFFEIFIVNRLIPPGTRIPLNFTEEES